MKGDVHRTWGYKDKKTGRISGLSGQLQRNEADIGGLNQTYRTFHLSFSVERIFLHK